MNLETLQELMDIKKRHVLFNDLLNIFKEYEEMDNVYCKCVQLKDGKIPIITIENSEVDANIKFVKVFIGAQHNEYNGLFGILEFFDSVRESKIKITEIMRRNQTLIFLPLMNPYGFLNPSKSNKSGYYLKNGTNLNRYWRKLFVPEYVNEEENLNGYKVPEQSIIVKNLLQKYWDDENLCLYIMDFHETSLMHRFLKKLSKNLKKELYTYKFEHWLEEKLIFNIIKLNQIPNLRQPIFYKCIPSADHTHINLTIKQIEFICEKLQEYITRNREKLAFYYCYSNRSKEYCEKLARKVYNNLRMKLWETEFPSYEHKFHDHGCFVNMNDATNRKRVYSMELETQKQLFNIFEEIEQCKVNPTYIENKLKSINKSIDIVIETINQMIHLN